MSPRRTTIADPISRTVSLDVVRFDCGPHALISTASDLGIRPYITDIYVVELVEHRTILTLTQTEEPNDADSSE